MLNLVDIWNGVRDVPTVISRGRGWSWNWLKRLLGVPVRVETVSGVPVVPAPVDTEWERRVLESEAFGLRRDIRRREKSVEILLEQGYPSLAQLQKDRLDTDTKRLAEVERLLKLHG